MRLFSFGEEFFRIGFSVLAFLHALFASAVAGHSAIQSKLADWSFVWFSKNAIHADGENVAVRVLTELFEYPAYDSQPGNQSPKAKSEFPSTVKFTVLG